MKKLYIQWAHTAFIHDICAYKHDFKVFLAAPMHMTPNKGHIPMMYCQLQSLKPLYMVSGALGIKIFGFKK